MHNKIIIKSIVLDIEMSYIAKFVVFTSTHIQKAHWFKVEERARVLSAEERKFARKIACVFFVQTSSNVN